LRVGDVDAVVEHLNAVEYLLDSAIVFYGALY